MEKTKIFQRCRILCLIGILFILFFAKGASATHKSWHIENYYELPESIEFDKAESREATDHLMEKFTELLDVVYGNHYYMIGMPYFAGTDGISIQINPLGELYEEEKKIYDEIISIQKEISNLKKKRKETEEKFKTTNAEYAYLVSELDSIDNKLGETEKRIDYLIICDENNADKNCDEKISLGDELVPFIGKWITESGEIKINDIVGAINLWISPEEKEDKKDNSPVLNLEFDEIIEGIAVDSSGNANGSINGAESVTSEIKWNAVKFDGDDRISIQDNEKINFGTGEFTLVSWIKMAGGEGARHIFGKRDTTGGGNWYRIYSFDGDLRFETNNGNLNSLKSIELDDENIISDISFFNDSAWHFVAAVRNSSTALLYIDGEKISAGVLNGDVSNNADFTIGKWAGEEGFVGEIDELKVYNKALNESEIQDIYSNEVQ